jgi:hypothetical protein
VSVEPGLRERKKQQTRALIAESARGLFVERGFDRVTVAGVARAANVSEAHGRYALRQNAPSPATPRSSPRR